MEGVIKNIKQQSARVINCDNQVLYFCSRFKDLEESNQVFASDLQKPSATIARRKGNAKTKTLAAKTKDKNEDAKINDVFMVEDTIPKNVLKIATFL